MATHRMDVSVRFGVPDLLETVVGTAQLSLLRVPDVRMHSEAAAIATIARAGLIPGQRDPRPRPVGARPEVVIRTHPREGTLVRRGTRVDYDLAPGEPRSLVMPIPIYVDYDAASTLDGASAALGSHSAESITQVASTGFIDYDVVDTVHDHVAGATEVTER
jgi:hypothetical protein